MSQYTPDVHRLLVLPDHRQVEDNIDLTNSTFTQYGPQVGAPVAQQDTEMVLESSGSQSASQTLQVFAGKGGFAGRDNLSAGFYWKQLADTKYRGYDPPQAMFGIEAPNWNAFASVRAQRGTRFPNGVVTPEGRVVAVTCDNNGSTASVASYTRSPSLWTWTGNGSLHSETNDGTHELHPCVCILPNGRVLCFFWTYDAVSQEAQVRMEYSDDNGANWALGSKYTLPEPLDTSTYVVEGMRVAYNNGQICLIFITSGTNEYRQYASDSLGADFTHVETTALGSTGANVDVCALPGGTGFILSDDTQTVISTYAFMVIGSAFQLASTGTGAEPAGSFSAVDGCQFCVDDNGTIYAYGLFRANEFLSVAASYDGGITWTVLGDEFAYASAISTYSNGHYPDRYSVVFTRGKVLVLHNFESTGGTYGGDYDNSFLVSHHGGYTTLTMPAQSLLDNDTRLSHWVYDWVCYNLPGDMVWTAAGVAAGETPNASGGIMFLDLSTAAGDSRTFSENVAGGVDVDLAHGMGCTAIFSCQDDTGSYPAIQIEIDDTSDEFQVEVRLDGTNLILYDVNGAGQIASVAIDPDTYYQVHFWLKSADGNTGECYCEYREWNLDEDREWLLLGESTTVVRGAAGPAQSYSILWGHIAAGAAQSQWVQVSFTKGQEVGLQLAEGQDNPGGLALRRISSSPTYIDDGVCLIATDGPAFADEEWRISTRYEFPWQNVLPTKAPSPNTVWRSSGLTDQDFVFDMGGIAAEGEDWENDLFAFAVLNTNASKISAAYETTPGGGWNNLTVSAMSATCSYTRAGKSVEITRHTILDDFQVTENELEGCHIVFDIAGARDVRVISRNTYGYVGDTADGTHKRPRLYCDGPVGAIDGTEGTSGTCEVYFKNAVFFQSLRGIQIATLRIRLEAFWFNPPSGYLQAGIIMFGPGYFFGWQPSQTRGRSFRPNVELTTGPDGRRTARKKGPRRRVVDLSWTEGVDESNYLAGEDDYIESSTIANAEVVAERHDVPNMLMGMWDYLDGPRTPVIYCPKIPKITSSSSTLANRFFWNQMGGAIYGRIVGDLELQTLIGSEESTEVIRVGGLTVEEEV